MLSVPSHPEDSYTALLTQKLSCSTYCFWISSPSSLLLFSCGAWSCARDQMCSLGVAQHKARPTEAFLRAEMEPCSALTFWCSFSPLQFSWLNRSDEQKDESPSSWRLGLRKTGSHNTLSEVTATREAQRDKAASIYRSSSTPRISALLDSKEKVWPLFHKGFVVCPSWDVYLVVLRQFPFSFHLLLGLYP